MAATIVRFKGASGVEYLYSVYPKGTPFVNQAGNYCFAVYRNGVVAPLYFGETESLKLRLNDKEHEREPCVTSLGWNVTCVHTSMDNRRERCREEADLRGAYDPPCNRQ